jgi:sialate O-acetylesterase
MFAAFLSSAHAEIRMPKLLSDHAVLQRGEPIHIWGWATPDSKVQIRLHEQTAAATTNALGEWSAWLAPESAGGPYTLTVDGDGGQATVTISDLLIGDVWLASGQSNMEMPLLGFPPTAVVKNAEAEIAAASNPRIRLLLVAKRSSEYPLHDGTASWTECTPATAAKFSAIAYFFGRTLESAEHVPIGLIDASWGGTPVDAWMSIESLSSDANFMPVFVNRGRFVKDMDREPAIIAAEKRQDEAAKAAGKPLPWHPRHGLAASWLPAGLYNGMIAPLTGASLKGVIWYQGESDTGDERAPNYALLFPALIRDWRSHFSQPNLPFLYAQISSFNTTQAGWPRVQDAQRRTLALRNTAMAVTTDVGQRDNIHPADKQTVAARLALAARALAYNETIAYEPPLFRRATGTPGGMRVWFDHANGLTAASARVEGFELAGEDRRFHPADAKIDGDTVVVTSTAVPDPRYVRYAWTGVAPPPLRNSIGLPAATFTSEEDLPH